MNPATSLSGISVLEVGEGWTAALAGKLLADLGAQVCKLEVPGRDPLRDFGRDEAERIAAYDLPNSGKQLLSGDQALQRLRAGLDDIDVLLVDAAVAARLGLDLGSAGPRTVICRFSPFDLDGPLADLVANDLTLQALSGVMATTGEPGGRPLRSGTEIASVIGALYGAIGTLAALIEREHSSLGQIVDVSLYDCLVSTLTNFASRVLGGVVALDRLGNQGPNSAPWELFDTSDGEYVFIIAGSPPTFERLSATMGRPELIEDPRFADPHKRRDNYDATTAVVADWARTLPRDEIVRLLRDNGVPVSPVASVKEVLTDPHLLSRGLLKSETDAEGRTRLLTGQPLGFGHSAITTGPGQGAAAIRPDPAAGDSPTARRRPLTGVRVVDFGTLTAGPFCTRLFANLGADVLKIEPPYGETGRHSPPVVDGQSVFFHITNNGKRSLSANLRDEDSTALVRRVIAQADILVENQAPGALDKRGLGAERLLAEAPNLIYTSVTGYGHEGVLGGLRAYDTVIQAGAGLMSTTGEDGGRPLKTGISTADVLGCLASATASLGAYYGRLTGRHAGVRLDVALFDICAWSTQMAWVTAESDLEIPTRYGNGHWLFAPYGVYDSGDERQVAIACETETQWQSLAAALEAGLPGQCPEGFATWPRADRWSRRHELDVLIQAYCSGRTAAETAALLQAARVPAAEVFEVHEVLTERQAFAHTTVDITADDGRTWKVTDVPIRLRSTPAAVTTPGPPLGHEDEIISHYPDKAWESVFET